MKLGLYILLYFLVGLLGGVLSVSGDGSTILYAYGPNGLLSKSELGATSYYHLDRLGSSTLITDTLGNTKYSTNYRPFGSPFEETGDETYTYTGKELDSTRLYYYGATNTSAILSDRI